MMVKGAKALEVWCRRVTDGYPGVDVSNMTTSWKDGLAFCAILHRYRPDRIDFHKLDKRDIRGNNLLAFKVAEDTFGIPQLLDPDDMAKCVAPDRLSILTYVSEYYHRLKSLQPRGNPLLSSIPSDQTQTMVNEASTKLSRTSSTSSSGVTSMASSCESSASSVCDSPPPSTSSGAGRSEDLLPKTSPEKSNPIEKETEKDSSDENVENDASKGMMAEQNLGQVVMRNKNGKTSEAQRRALATRRRLVQSMIVESSSGMSSLCSPSPSPPSPAIEKENPFREAMMKFVAMEQEEDKKSKKKAKVFCTKSTETPVPTRDSKSTQTIPSFVASNSSPSRGDDGGTFRTCLRTQVSCPPTTGTRPRAPSTGPLSYTSTPRPYNSQSTSALNRSLTNIASPHGSPMSPPLVQLRQDQRSLPTSAHAHRRPLSMLVSAQNESPDYRHQRLGPAPPLPGTAYTPPMYHQNSYSIHSSSPAWSPNTSIYVTPLGSGGSPSSGYGSSVYSTPVGGSPCRNRYTATPTGPGSPMRYNRQGGYHHHPADRLQLHIEGQSSLV